MSQAWDRSFEYPTTKRKVAALEVEQEEDNGSDDEPTKEVVPSIPTAVMHMKVEQEPTMLQIKGFLNSIFSSMILIDSSSTHNMMSVSFAQKLGIPSIPIMPCYVLLPNNQSSFIIHRVLRVPVSIHGVDTEEDFEVWDGARYEVILGMTWLYRMHSRCMDRMQRRSSERKASER